MLAVAPVVQEEQALADAPQRRGAELVGAGPALGDAVGQALPMWWSATSENGAVGARC